MRDKDNSLPAVFTALVTGANRGIGWAVAKGLLEAGIRSISGAAPRKRS